MAGSKRTTRMRAGLLAAAVAAPLAISGATAQRAAARESRDVSPAAVAARQHAGHGAWHHGYRGYRGYRGGVRQARRDWGSWDPFCTSHAGPFLRPIERMLGLVGHGYQTRGNCLAIRRYQLAHRIHPAVGFAGPITWHMLTGEWWTAREYQEHYRVRRQRPATGPAVTHPRVQRHRVQRHHSRRPRRRPLTVTRGHCLKGNFRIACVDQNRQLMWVQVGSRVIFGPVPVRTGARGYRTRDGLYRVSWKQRHHVSSLYGTPMPYSQFFDGGEAFHGIYGSVYDPPGSYGCVNLRMPDARRLWTTLRVGDRVEVWGRRPGS